MPLVIRPEKIKSTLRIDTVSTMQLPFIANEGQIADPSVVFYANTFGGTVYITRDGQLVYFLPKVEEKANAQPSDGLSEDKEKPRPQRQIIGGWSLQEQLVGASSTSPQGIEAVQTKVNYFVGSDNRQWHSNIAAYNMVSLGEVYPGINVTLKTRGNNVEKIFTVNPGADAGNIKLKLEGANSLAINDRGELEIGTGFGPVCFSKPVAYQERDGKKEYVQVAYYLDKNIYGFTVGEYDKSLPLIIDPLLASTFIGGSSSDVINSLVIDSDSEGNVYAAGYTYSTDYPTTSGAYDTSYNGGNDVFVSKLDAGLSTLLASTFIGGSEDSEEANSLVIDSADNVYVTGGTWSTDYPTLAGAYDTSHNGGNDVFISKLDSGLSTLLASTFIGGSEEDTAYSMTIDSIGNVYVTGDTGLFVPLLMDTGLKDNIPESNTMEDIESEDYPTTFGAFDTSFNDWSLYGGGDAFISKLDAYLSTLLASTFIGGEGYDEANSLAIDVAGNVYVAGYTGAYDYPTTPGAYNAYSNGYDAFLSKLSGDLSADAGEYEEVLRFILGKFICAFYGNDPVNLSTGNFILEATDLKIPGRGIPLEFTRFYNSLDHNSGSLGPGWTHNYNTRLIFNEDDSVNVSYADGHEYTFSFDGANYLRPAGCFETLASGPDNTYVLTFKNQTKYTYNSNGRLISLSDNNGNTTIVTYDSGHMTTITDSSGRSLNFTYDSNDQLQTITDPADRTVVFAYDQNGNLSSVTDVNGGITQYAYDSNGLTSIINPEGYEILRNAYDSHSRVTRQMDGEGHVSYFAYDPENRQTMMADAKGNVAILTYDENYRVTGIAYPENITEAYTYDENNCRTSATDKNGYTTTNTYDDMGNMLTQTSPEPFNYITTYEYDSLNNPVLVTDNADYTTDYTYDEKGNLTTVSKQVYAGTATTIFAYDLYGQIISITDENNNTTTVTNDVYGNMASSTDPLGFITTYTYDTIGRRLTQTDPRGNLPGANPEDYQWTYTYDLVGNLLTTTDPLGNTITNVYDLNNNLTSTTDPKNNTTTFTYDGNSKLLTTTDPLDNVTFMEYDPNGNLAYQTDANNNTTIYDYDALDRLISITDPEGNTESYTLDGNGNILTLTDPNNHTTSYTYDNLNRLTQVTDPLEGTVTYTYDPLGNKLSETNQSGNTTTYTYDQSSRLLSVTEPGDKTTQYTYDLAGNMLSMTEILWITQQPSPMKNWTGSLRKPIL